MYIELFCLSFVCVFFLLASGRSEGSGQGLAPLYFTPIYKKPPLRSIRGCWLPTATYYCHPNRFSGSATVNSLLYNSSI